MSNFNAFYNPSIQVLFWGLLGIGTAIATHAGGRRPASTSSTASGRGTERRRWTHGIRGAALAARRRASSAGAVWLSIEMLLGNWWSGGVVPRPIAARRP